MNLLNVLSDLAAIVTAFVATCVGMLLLAGQTGIVQVMWGFMVPALIGNVIGGTVLFALISYAQVMKEI